MILPHVAAAAAMLSARRLVCVVSSNTPAQREPGVVSGERRRVVAQTATPPTFEDLPAQKETPAA